MSELRLRETDGRLVRRWLPLVVGLGVGIRAALGWMHPFAQPDSEEYVALGRAIAAWQPYAAHGWVAARMPGYPIFLGLVFWCGGGVKAALVLQGLMSGGIMVLTFLLGRRVSAAVGMMAAGLVAVDPLSVGFSAALLTETPFTLCLMLALWLAVRIGESKGVAWKLWVALGVVWGVGVYVRVSGLWLIVPLAVVAGWPGSWREAGGRRRMVMAAVPLVVTVVMLLPWWGRNYGIFHTGFFRLTTLEGISLYESVYPEADGGPRQDKIVVPEEMKGLDEAQRSDAWSRLAWRCVEEDPWRMAQLAVVKIRRTWSPWFNTAEMQSQPVQVVMTLWYVPLYGLAVLGLWRMERRMLMVVLVPVVYFTMLHALFLGSVRYRVPVMPVVCLLAGSGVEFLMGKWGWGKRWRSSAV